MTGNDIALKKPARTRPAASDVARVDAIRELTVALTDTLPTPIAGTNWGSQLNTYLTDFATAFVNFTTQAALDLTDATVSGSSGQLALGVTSNVVSGGSYTSPAVPGAVGTPAARWAVAVPASATSNVTVAYPNSAGSTVTESLPPGSRRTYRQKSTSGWGVESGNTELSYFAGTYPLLTNLVADSRFRTDKASRRLVAAGNCWVPGRTTANSAVGTARTLHPVPHALTDVVLTYANFAVLDPATKGVDTDGTVTQNGMAAAIIGTDGTIYPVTVGGQLTWVLGPGGRVDTDPIALEFPDAAVMQVLTYVPTTGYYPNGVTYTPSSGGFTANSNLTAAGSAAIPDASAYVFQPVMISGTPTKRNAPTLVSVTDSIGVGTGDFAPYGNLYNGLQSGGFINRACASAGVPLLALGHSGETVAGNLLTVNHFRRHAFMTAGTHMLDELGVNDLNVATPPTLAAFAALKLQLWALGVRRGLRVFATTLTPESTSTNGWIDLTNQSTKTSESTRVPFNNWLRAGAPIDPAAFTYVAVGTSGALLAGQSGHPLIGYFEVADTIESARDSGKWDTTSVVACTATTTTASSTVVNDSTGPFAASSVGKLLYIPGAGASGVALATIIKGYASATQVTVVTAASTAVSAVTAYLGVPTVEGIHPSPIHHQRMAAAIDTTKFVLPIAA